MMNVSSVSAMPKSAFDSACVYSGSVTSATTAEAMLDAW